MPQIKITKKKEDNQRIERIIEFLQPTESARLDFQEAVKPGRTSGLHSQSSSIQLPKDNSKRNSIQHLSKIKNLRTINSLNK
jgi:hypothetical protein